MQNDHKKTQNNYKETKCMMEVGSFEISIPAPEGYQDFGINTWTTLYFEFSVYNSTISFSFSKIWQISFFQMHQCFSRTWCLPKLNSLKCNIVLSKTANVWFKSGNIWSKNKAFNGNFASFQYSVIQKHFGKYSKMILVNILTCRRHKQTK